jgi:ACT domain-containing protein
MSSSHGSTVPVSDAVSTIILRNHMVYEALKLKIVNYHALALRISSEVEELTGRKANIETVVVAIKRFSDRLSEGQMEEMSDVLEGARLNLAGGAAEVTIGAKGAEAHQVLQDILKLASKFTEAPNIFQLPNSVKLIAEEEDAVLLEKVLSRKYPLSLKKNVAKITVRMPPAAEKAPGIVSLITELLYRNGISILDAFLSYEDIVMIVHEKSGAKAYQVLSEKISE